MEIDIKDYDAYHTTKGNILQVTLINYETEQEIAWYKLEIDDYLHYKIKQKDYVDTITIQETKQCDKYLIEAYENNYFEDYLLRFFEDEEELGWFI